jgi:hypothetical protein
MRYAQIPIFILTGILLSHDSECFHAGGSLFSKGITQLKPLLSNEISVNPVPYIQHATKLRVSSLFALNFQQSPLILHCSKTVNADDVFLDQESYTDEEIEELVAKTELLWAEAYDARKLADELSDQVEKLAAEIENKVSTQYIFKS